jgi:hypothetical protein
MMLIDKGPTIGDVVSLKLSSGEEIIARLDEQSDTEYKLGKPMVIAMGPNGPGLIPFMFTAGTQKSVPVSRRAVSVITASDKQFADQYISSTTGIQMV